MGKKGGEGLNLSAWMRKEREDTPSPAAKEGGRKSSYLSLNERGRKASLSFSSEKKCTRFGGREYHFPVAKKKKKSKSAALPPKIRRGGRGKPASITASLASPW